MLCPWISVNAARSLSSLASRTRSTSSISFLHAREARARRLPLARVTADQQRPGCGQRDDDHEDQERQDVGHQDITAITPPLAGRGPNARPVSLSIFAQISSSYASAMSSAASRARIAKQSRR